MDVKIVTLRYCPELRAIDDTPLVALARDYEVHEVREHFFVVHDVPHLLCVVSCQRRPGQASIAPARAHAEASAPVSASTGAPSPASAGTLPEPPAPGPASAAELTPDQRRRFETLRRWRNATAHELGVPAYVVLTNRNIVELVRDLPSSLAGLGQIRGIGKAKVERHGEALLALLRGDEPPPTEAKVGRSVGTSPPGVTDDAGGEATHPSPTLDAADDEPAHTSSTGDEPSASDEPRTPAPAPASIEATS